MESSKPHTNQAPGDPADAFQGPDHAKKASKNGEVSYLPDDTERVEAQERLHFQAQLLDAVGQAIVATDLQGRVIYWNRCAEQLYGWSAHQVMGRVLLEFLVSEDLSESAEEIMEQLRAGRSWSGEFMVRRKDGTSFPAMITDTPVYDDQGDLIGIIGVSSDVTEQKLAEDRLRKAEERYRTLVERVPAVTYIRRATANWAVTYVSPQMKDLLGYEPEECTSNPGHWQKIIHPEDLERVLAEDRRVNETGEPFSMEYRQFAKDGRVVWVRDEATLVRNEDGEPLYWLGVQTDVTERKKVERALSRSEASLVESQRIAHLGTWVWDVATGEVWWSEETYRIHGLDPGEEADLREKVEEAYFPEDLPAYRKKIDEALSGEASDYDYEHRIRRPDGEVRWVHGQAEVVRGEGGEPLRMVGTVQDVTERKQAEAKLIEAEARYRSLVEQVPAAIYRQEIEHNGAISYISPQIESLTGYAPEEYADPTFWVRTMHPEDRQRVLAEGERTDRTGEPYRVEFRKITRDGRLIWLRDEAVLVRDSAGEPLYWQGVVSDITERKALEERLEHQAVHDSLTNLPNRLLFVDRLGQALRRTSRRNDRRAAVLFMDLDGFKVVNDSLGHKAGDLLLVVVAERLRRCLRPEDTLARFGGDEFVVLVEDVEEPSAAVRVAKRISDELRKPFLIEGRELYVAASIGIAVGGDPTKSPEDLLRDADTAMYQAKDEAADYRVFDRSMYLRVVDRLEQENDLRRAAERNEFVLHYQPIMNLEDGKVWGVEALVRWDHPERGLLNPGEFVALAEDSGLVIPMGERVLEEACRQAKEWRNAHPHAAPLVMSVNLSAKQLGRTDLTETIAGTLERTGFDGSCLSLDVTETAYVEVLEGNLAALDRLRGMGVTISIDDFGTGYSSLSYLKRLPADALKIDQSFVSGLGEDPEDMAVVRMIIELAHTFGMQVIAEGVETEEQAALLEEMGCDLAQGYLFSEPLAAK